mmetsp:Transcript_7006/g.17383  ORF Transcript_7006/g.17383 Transcript_7006/m.17383 type:complete len:200 (+) Transcript_7006:194-793(+)
MHNMQVMNSKKPMAEIKWIHDKKKVQYAVLFQYYLSRGANKGRNKPRESSLTNIVEFSPLVQPSVPIDALSVVASRGRIRTEQVEPKPLPIAHGTRSLVVPYARFVRIMLGTRVFRRTVGDGVRGGPAGGGDGRRGRGGRGCRRPRRRRRRRQRHDAVRAGRRTPQDLLSGTGILDRPGRLGGRRGSLSPRVLGTPDRE